MGKPLTDADGNVREVTTEYFQPFRRLSEVDPELHALTQNSPLMDKYHEKV